MSTWVKGVGIPPGEGLPRRSCAIVCRACAFQMGDEGLEPVRRLVLDPGEGNEWGAGVRLAALGGTISTETIS